MSGSFADRLHDARLESGKMQVQIAWETGIAVSALSHYESGAREPNLVNFRRLCLALEISADRLLGLHDAMENRMERMEGRMGSMEKKMADVISVYPEAEFRSVEA